MKIAKNAILLVFVFSLTACETLMTRGEVREAEQKRQMQDQVVNLQRTTADVNNRFSDIEADLRGLHGRVEVVENKLSLSGRDREQLKASAEQSSLENGKKIQILQDEILRMQEQMGLMNAELTALKSAGAHDNSNSSSAAKKDLFQIAEGNFDKKEWRKAILNYQKFRDANPKHKKFPLASYKIGVSFQELGMKDEAKTFYDEVIAKFPNSSEAKKSRTRLKNMKK